jgi:HlyD family secretion protein
MASPDPSRRPSGTRWSTWPVRLALLAGALLAALVAWRLVRAPEAAGWVVESRPIVQRVVATGRVRPPARANLATLVPGRIRAVAVREGDRVQAGQVLLQLDDAEAAAALRQAEGRVAEAAARLSQVKGVSGRQGAEALRQAELRVAQAEEDAGRARTLGDAGVGSRQAVDDAERAVQVARSQREAARAQAAASAGGADERLALAALAQAEAGRAMAAARLGEMRLLAPAAGQVVARDAEAGDVAQAGKALLAMTLEGPLELAAQVDEKNLALLASGQPAQASADAFPDLRFEAAVGLIAPAVDAARGTVEVRFRVPSPPATLRADMTVTVDVEVGRKASGLVVPAEAIRDAGGQPWALAVAGGLAERRAVRLGLRGDGLVEVVEGLREGEAVLAPVAGVVAGQRVRPRLQPRPEAGRAL